MKLPSRSLLRRFFHESIVATMIATMLLPTRLPAEEGDCCDPELECDAGLLCVNNVCEGENIFNVVNGNARRRISDLRMLGAVSGSLDWKRFHNTVPRPGRTSLGTAGSWRHNWQFELLNSTAGGASKNIFLLVLPYGNQVVFTLTATGKWTTKSALQERLEIDGSGVIVTTHDGSRLNFVRRDRAGDPRYELASHTSAQGIVITLDYDEAGNLIRVREPAGRALFLKYAAVAGKGRPSLPGVFLSEVIGSDGRTVRYTYETIADPVSGSEYAALKEARYGDGTVASYTYAFACPGAQPLLVDADDPRYDGTAKRIGYTYHAPLGMIRDETNPKTGAVYSRLEWNPAQPNRRVVRYSDLRQVSFELSPDCESVVSRTDSLGRTVRFERDELRRITAKVEHGGRRTEFSWDAASRQLREKRPGQTERRIERDSAGRATKETDPHGRVTTSERDAAGRVIRERFHDGTTKETTYDALGFVTETRERDGNVHRYRRNADHLVAEYVDPTGQVHRYAYDTSARSTSSTDPLGRVTRFEYNDRGDVTKVTRPDGLSNLIHHDAYGRIVVFTDEQSRTTRHTYDDLSRIVRREDPSGGVTTYDYAELPKGCGSCSLSARPTRIVAPDGTVTANLYDTEGRLLSTTVAQGTAAQATTTFVYDDDDNLVAKTDPLGHVTRYTYDDDRHRLTQTDPLGRITRWSYDARGNVLSQTAPDGAVTQYTYNLADRRVSTTDANGATTKFTYDAAGRQTSLTDARGSVYRFTFDALGRKTAMIYPDDFRESWSYNATGQLATYTTRAGQVKTSSYDNAGRLTTEKWSPAGAASDVSYVYDAEGRVSSVSNGVSTLRYTYDSVGRMVSETSDLSALLPGMPPRTVGYAYDVLGRRTQLVYPDGTVVKQRYDARGKLVAVATDGDNPIATWSYDATGRTTAIARANGVATAYSYDDAGQLLEVAHRKGDNVLALARYTLDAGGRRISQTREEGITETYSYDATGQLTRVDYGTTPTRNETFAYDAVGNRLNSADSEARNSAAPAFLQFVTNSNNQYTTLIASGRPSDTRMLNYDRNGGLEHDGVRSYRYNALSQLVEVTSRDTRVTMAYDVRERCVLRRFYHKGAQAQWQEDLVKGRLLTYSNWDLIHESHLNSGLHDSYYHGASTNEVMAALFGAEKKPSNLLFPIYDGIGSTVAVVTGTGVVSKRFRYNVFGQPSTTLVGARTQSEEADFRFLFTGSQWVPEINQYYNRHRYYNPELGRWLTFDPIQFKSGDFNSLRYANNDSINSTDPYGLACDPASLQACRDACQFGLEVCCVAGTLVCIGSGPGYIACLVGFCGICGFDYSICMLGCRFGWW